MSREEIFRAALSLPDEARAELADRLLDSLNGETEDEEIDQDEINARWEWEIKDRIAACDRGEIPEIPGEEVFASLQFRNKV